jgi:hypothetical protein
MHGPQLDSWTCACGARNVLRATECYRCHVPFGWDQQAVAAAPPEDLPPRSSGTRFWWFTGRALKGTLAGLAILAIVLFKFWPLIVIPFRIYLALRNPLPPMPAPPAMAPNAPVMPPPPAVTRTPVSAPSPAYVPPATPVPSRLEPAMSLPVRTLTPGKPPEPVPPSPPGSY